MRSFAIARGGGGLVLTLVTLLSCTRCGLSFLSPQTCPLSLLEGHTRQAKTSIVKRHAATTVSGGVSSGKRERGKPAASSGREKNVAPSTPPKAPSVSADTTTTAASSINNPNQTPPLSTGASPGNVSASTTKAGATTTTASGKDAPQIGISTGASTTTRDGAKDSEGASSSLPPSAAAVSKPGVVTTTAAGASSGSATGKAMGSAVSMEGGAAAPAVGRDEVKASPASSPKKKQNFAAGPETTAAEKVLTLLDIGLVSKEEVGAYYDALSELERTTREAKAAAAVAATSSPNPSSRPRAAMPYSPRDGPLSLVPLPAVCAALGAAGTQSLHLVGGIGTAVSIFGAMAGVAIGGLVVIGDDPLGRLARAAGAAVVRSTGAAGGAAGKSVSESVAGAAGAAAGAVEEAVVKAPSNFVGGLARSISSAVSAAFGSAVDLPGALVTKAADGAKGALKETSDAVVAIPGEVARKASRAAGSALQSTSAAAASAVGGALQSTSEAAVTAVKGSPKRAGEESLKGSVSSPVKTLAGFMKLPSRAGAGGSKKAEKVQRAATTMASTSTASIGSKPTTAPSKQAEEEEPEGIPVQELEAKMLSVKKALERFDSVKARIEKAETSGTLFKAVGVTRSMNVSAEMEKGEKARAAAASAAAAAAVAQRAKDAPMESTSPSPTTQATRQTPIKTAKTTTGRKSSDQDRRKQVAERLLEKASQRAAEAKAGLKAAAASARRGAEVKSPAVAGGSTNDL